MIGNINLMSGEVWIAAQHQLDETQDQSGLPGAGPVAAAFKECDTFHRLSFSGRRWRVAVNKGGGKQSATILCRGCWVHRGQDVSRPCDAFLIVPGGPMPAQGTSKSLQDLLGAGAAAPLKRASDVVGGLLNGSQQAQVFRVGAAGFRQAEEVQRVASPEPLGLPQHLQLLSGELTDAFQHSKPGPRVRLRFDERAVA